MDTPIRIMDKQFKPYLTENQIKNAVAKIAAQINKELAAELPVFLVVLNGSFMFAGDLLREVTIPCEISFIKLSSYSGAQSIGSTTELLGISEDLSGRTVVIVEDIVDSGLTIEKIIMQLNAMKVKQARVATALFKPSAYTRPFKIDYIGFSISNDFVVGYGMDYNGQGRNLREIHVLA
jgi:hypoxanthine phosphoribosyltransferase